MCVTPGGYIGRECWPVEVENAKVAVREGPWTRGTEVAGYNGYTTR